MSPKIEESKFLPEDFARFRKELQAETETLEKWFQQKVFAEDLQIAGLELETWLVSQDYSPTPENERLLQNLKHPAVGPELSRFNIEINVTPFPVTGNILRNFQADLQQFWANCNACASKISSEMVMVGILPTVKEEDLITENMSDHPRYRALNEQVMALRRGKELKLNIKGKDHLKTTCGHVMLESAATSLQIHLQINQNDAARSYNAALIASAPLVAAAANSPFLFGRDLWDETRIPLFEQAVDLENARLWREGVHNRVTFGTGFAKQSLMECFSENLKRYSVLLPILTENANGELPHLRLHNSTIWRWHRPLVGFDSDHKPHLRIEHRILPAGPTVSDVVANVALTLGINEAFVQSDKPPEDRISFNQTRKNFYLAAKKGLNAKIRWLDRKPVFVRDLLLEEIIPQAKLGLRNLGIDVLDIEFFMDYVLRTRIETGRTGAAWQRAFIAKHGADFKALTAAYAKNQRRAKPVHEWTV